MDSVYINDGSVIKRKKKTHIIVKLNLWKNCNV